MKKRRSLDDRNFGARVPIGFLFINGWTLQNRVKVLKILPYLLFCYDWRAKVLASVRSRMEKMQKLEGLRPPCVTLFVS